MASRFWVGGTGTWNGTATTHWSATSGGVAGASVPTSADDVFFDGSSGTGTITVTSGGVCVARNFDCTGAGAITFAGAQLGVNMFGTTVTLSSNITFAAPTLSLFAPSGTVLLTTAGRPIGGLNIGTASSTATISLQDAVTVTTSGGNLGTITLNFGTLQLNNLTATCALFSTSNSNTRAVAGTGTINLTSTAATTVWNAATGTGLTVASTVTVAVNSTSANSRTFAGGGRTYGTLTYTVAGSTGALVITGANTFDTVNFSDVTNARTLTLPSSITTTVTTWNVNGTSGKLMTVNSSTSGTAATLSKASGTVSSDFLSVKDSTATGGAAWFAGANSTNVSGNTGWTFTVPTFTGSAAQTLPSFTQAATGTVTKPTYTATSAQTLPSFTQAASGTVTQPTYTGTAAQTLPAFTQTATGTVTQPVYTATSAQTLPAFGQQATGTTTPPTYTATATQTLPAFGQAATGTFTAPTYTAVAVSTLPSFTQQATGTVTPPVYTATAAQTLPSFTQAATGTVTALVATVKGYSTSSVTPTGTSSSSVTVTTGSTATLTTIGTATGDVTQVGTATAGVQLVGSSSGGAS